MTFAPISISPANGWIGVWMFGDNSGNQLELWFNGSSQQISFGAINWFGWKFVTVPITGSMTSLNSIVIRQVNNAEASGNLYFDNLQVQISTGVHADIEHKSFALHQNYPNPFNPSTSIAFDLERPEQVTLSVFNTLGQQIATLVNSRFDAGHHHVTFSGRGSDGKNLTSGVYVYRLQTSAGIEVKKMMLLK
jgi:hypothetical protein